MRIAFIGTPHVGGTYVVYRLLRQGLAPYGHEIRIIDFGFLYAHGKSVVAEEGSQDVQGAQSADPPVLTRQFIDHLLQHQYDVVVFNTGTPGILMNAARFLPASVKRIVIVHTMTRGAYAPTHAIAPYVDHIVAVSKRIYLDLTDRWRIPGNKVTTIFHGADVAKFSKPRVEAGTGEPLRLLFLGRISDYDKGVLRLPAILKESLRRTPRLRLDVVGHGPDEQLLREGFERLGVASRVRFDGGIPFDSVPDCMLSHDVFLMPSRWEGCGAALLEAMAGGCVPIATRIRDSTPLIIEHGVSGFLCRPGSKRAFVNSIATLEQDRDLLVRMGAQARRRMAESFSLDRMAAAYAHILDQIAGFPDTRLVPQPFEQFSIHPSLLPSWRTLIPVPVKKVLRTWLERIGRSV